MIQGKGKNKQGKTGLEDPSVRLAIGFFYKSYKLQYYWPVVVGVGSTPCLVPSGLSPQEWICLSRQGPALRCVSICRCRC